MSDRNRKLLFSAIGIILAVVPTALAVLSYFPLWRERGTATMVSGVSLIMIMVAALPLMRYMKQIFKSPSVTTLWFATFIIFSFLSKIAEDMTVIAFVGFISNLAASLFFAIAKMRKEPTDE